MSLNTVSSDFFKEILVYLDVHDIRALWLTGNSRVQALLGPAGAVQTLRIRDRFLCPSFVPLLAGLVEFEYSLSQDILYYYALDLPLTSLPKTLKKLSLTCSNAFLSLFSARLPSVADLFPQLEHLSISSYWTTHKVVESRIILPPTLQVLRFSSTKPHGVSPRFFATLPKSVEELEVDLSDEAQTLDWCSNTLFPPALQKLVVRRLDSLQLLCYVPSSVTHLELYLQNAEEDSWTPIELSYFSRLSEMSQLVHLTIMERTLTPELFKQLPRGSLKEIRVKTLFSEKLDTLALVLPCASNLERLYMNAQYDERYPMHTTFPRLKEWEGLYFNCLSAPIPSLVLPLILPSFLQVAHFRTLTPVTAAFLPQTLTKLTIENLEKPSNALQHFSRLSQLQTLLIHDTENEMVSTEVDAKEYWSANSEWVPRRVEELICRVEHILLFLPSVDAENRVVANTNEFAKEGRVFSKDTQIKRLSVRDYRAMMSSVRPLNADWIRALPSSIVVLNLTCMEAISADVLTVLPKSLTAFSLSHIIDCYNDHFAKLPKGLTALRINRGICHLTLEGAKALPKRLRILGTPKLAWANSTPIATLLEVLPPHLQLFYPSSSGSGYASWVKHREQISTLLESQNSSLSGALNPLWNLPSLVP